MEGESDTMSIEYRIEHSTSLTELVIAVNAHLSEGWRPSGGLAICPDGYFQALTREWVDGDVI